MGQRQEGTMLVGQRIWRLFSMGLWLGSTVIGGIAVAYPVIRTRAQENGWLSGEEVDGLYALAVLLPGPSFINLWGAVAGRVAGVPGAVAALAGLLLPSFFLVMMITVLVRLPAVAVHSSGLMQGAAWATAGLIGLAGIEGFQKLRSRWQKGQVAAVLGLLALGLHPLLLLGLSVLFGASVPQLAGRKEQA